MSYNLIARYRGLNELLECELESELGKGASFVGSSTDGLREIGWRYQTEKARNNAEKKLKRFNKIKTKAYNEGI